MQKKLKRAIHGVLLLDKPIGLTSHTAMQQVKRLYAAEKAGHAGSLDPLATGMLPILLGEATKFSPFLLNADKTYHVVAKLGVTTTTGDAEGEVLTRRPVAVYPHIYALLEQFTGPQMQIPPMYSALKHEGQPLYKLARKGIEIERAPRAFHVYSLTLRAATVDTLSLEVHCSKGTYVRVLVHDIGEALGCGATVEALRRTSVGDYPDGKMETLPELQTLAAQSLDALDAKLLPLDSMLANLPSVVLTALTTRLVLQGQAVLVPNAPSQGWVRLLSAERFFLGIGKVQEDGKIGPKRLIAHQKSLVSDVL